MPTMLLLTLQLPLLESRRLGLGSLLSIRDAFTKVLIARAGVRTRANRSGRKRSSSQLHDLWESRPLQASYPCCGGCCLRCCLRSHWQRSCRRCPPRIRQYRAGWLPLSLHARWAWAQRRLFISALAKTSCLSEGFKSQLRKERKESHMQ